MNVDSELISGLFVAIALVFHCVACIRQANTMKLPIIKRRPHR